MKILLAIGAVALCAASATADVITVPGDAGSIGQAIAEATNGDEIVVGPGTWNETIDFAGKAITVRSSAGAAATIIDGQKIWRGVNCHLGEGRDTVVQGFTFTNCAVNGNGGAVIIRNASSPTILDCVFTANTAMANGGAIAVRGESAPIVERCTFSSNGAPRTGGAVFVEASTIDLVDCTFTDNSSFWTPAKKLPAESHVGGAVAAMGGATVTLDGCVLTGNRSHNGGGAIYSTASTLVLNGCQLDDNTRVAAKGISTAGWGGAIWCRGGGSLTLADCTLDGNSTSHSGGAIAVEAADVSITGCTFTDNHASNAVSSEGGAIHLNAVAGAIDGCSFIDNVGAEGGAIYTTGSSAAGPLEITDCTFDGNSAQRNGGGLRCRFSSSPLVNGCEFRGNQGLLTGGGIATSVGSSPTVTATLLCQNVPSNVIGDWGDGGGNTIWGVCNPGPGDVDKNGRVDMDDLQTVIRAWGTNDIEADADGDGDNDVNDLIIVLVNWS